MCADSVKYSLNMRSIASVGLLAFTPLFGISFSASVLPYQNTTTNTTAPVQGFNATSNPFATLLIDNFNNAASNALGFYHGTSGDANMANFDNIHPGNELKVSTGNIDGLFQSRYILHVD